MPVLIEDVGIVKGHSRGLFRCVCGVEFEAFKTNVGQGLTKSCGCLRRRRARETRTTHGATAGRRLTTEYVAYFNARRRCEDEKDDSYMYYGAKGVEFRFKSFEQFREHVGPKPFPDMSLDRIDPYGHYEPGNVKWSTSKEQRANQRD